MEYFDDFTCRACLSNEPELTLYSLNDSKIRDLYTTCTSLEVCEIIRSLEFSDQFHILISPMIIILDIG